MKPELSPDTDFAAGLILPVNKPLGWTSSDVVRKVKVLLRRLGHRKIKVGHAGTLDPLASGILLVCIGRATKQAETLQAGEKEYLATVALGATTPSYDLEHPIDERYPYAHITRDMVEEAIAGMTGEQLQEPPVYSAKMVDGKRAYEYARGGKEVPMRRSPVTIYAITLEEMVFPQGEGAVRENDGVRIGHRSLSDGGTVAADQSLPRVTLRVACSKGTYIRSLARDLGEKVGSGGHLTALCRTRSGDFTLADCYAPAEIEAAWQVAPGK